MKRKNLFKLKGLACFVIAGILLVGSLFVPTVKYKVTDINGLENNGSYSLAIKTLMDIEKNNGASDEEIAQKYGKYLEAADKDYSVLTSTTSATLYKDAKTVYKNWKTSEIKFGQLKPPMQMKICYYLISVYQEELSLVERLASEIKLERYTDAEILNFLKSRTSVADALKELLNKETVKKVLYTDKELEEGKADGSYVYQLEQGLSDYRTYLNALLSSTDDIYVKDAEYSYSFDVSSPFQWALNASNIGNIAELIDRSELIAKNKDVIEKSTAKITAYNEIADYYKNLLDLQDDKVIQYAQNDLNNVAALISTKEALLAVAKAEKEEKQTWIDNNLKKIEDEIKDLQNQVTEKQEALDSKNKTEVKNVEKTIKTSIKNNITPIKKAIANIENYYTVVNGLKTLLGNLGDINNATYNSYCDDIDACLVSINNAKAEKQTELDTAYANLKNEQTGEVWRLKAEIEYLNSQIETKFADRDQILTFIDEKEVEIKAFEDWIAIAKNADKEENPVNYYKYILSSINAKKDLLSKSAEFYEIYNEFDDTDKTTYKAISDILTEVKALAVFNDFLDAETNKNINEASGELAVLNNSLKTTYDTVAQIEAENAELNAEIKDATDFISENYEKYAASLNDASFSYVLYYRDTENMLSPTQIQTQPELQYELLYGIVHTYGVDTKTVSYLSFAVLFVGIGLCLFFILDTVIKAIKAHDKQKFYLVGINAFVKAAALFAGWTVFNILINSLTFGNATLTVGGIIMTALCVIGLVINFISGMSSDAYFLNKKPINVIIVFSAVQAVLLSLALAIFMLGGAAKPFVTAMGDIYASRKWIPVSVAWAVISMFIVIAGSIQIFKLFRIASFAATKIGSLSGKHKHVNVLFKCKSLIAILTCFVAMFVILIICMPNVSVTIRDVIVGMILVAAALAIRIIQVKALKTNHSKFTIGKMSDILTKIHTAPIGEEK